jgi:Tol biopolymer transport system component
VARVPGRQRLHDIDRDGRVLLAVESMRVGAIYGRGDEERDLGWLDSSFAMQLSPDGKALLLNEQGEGGGPRYSVYLRGIDGSPAVRLGDGFGGTFSPDGRWVATILLGDPPRLALLPIGPGEPRTLPATGIVYQFPGWFPDGRRLVFAGVQSGHGMRLYEQELSGAPPRPITPEGFGDLAPPPVSPDSKWAATLGPGGRAFLVPLGGGEPVPLPELQPGDVPMGFSPDGQALYCRRGGGVSVEFVRFDLRRRTRQIVRTARPADPTGIVALFPFDVSPGTGAYVYSYVRILSDLFLVEGLR